MQRLFRTFSLTLVLSLLLAGNIFSEEMKKTFKGIDEIKIKTVSGDCIIQKGSGDEVTVEVHFTYHESEFEPELEQRGSRLELTERFLSRHSSGNSTWSLTVPEKTAIDFSTASGDLKAADLKSSIEASTASGNIDLKNITGECRGSTASGDVDVRQITGRIQFSTASGDVTVFKVTGDAKISTASGSIRAEEVSGKLDFSTASGNITASKAKGELELSAASGDVDARDVVLTERGTFSAASGDVEVRLAQGVEHDLKVSSASGDAVLNFNGHPVRGFIEMTAKVRRGRISAPFEFDNEDYYQRDRDEYVTKTVRRGSDRPRIEILTASGDAILREK